MDKVLIYIYILLISLTPGANVIKLFFNFRTTLVSVRIGWKGWPGTNTLAYYANSYITDVKGFVTVGLVFNRHLWHIKTVVFLHQCSVCAFILDRVIVASV